MLFIGLMKSIIQNGNAFKGTYFWVFMVNEEKNDVIANERTIFRTAYGLPYQTEYVQLVKKGDFIGAFKVLQSIPFPPDTSLSDYVAALITVNRGLAHLLSLPRDNNLETELAELSKYRELGGYSLLDSELRLLAEYKELGNPEKIKKTLTDLGGRLDEIEKHVKPATTEKVIESLEILDEYRNSIPGCDDEEKQKYLERVGKSRLEDAMNDAVTAIQMSR
jgi:hypothetical protein